MGESQYEIFAVTGRLDALTTGEVEMRCFATMSAMDARSGPLLIDLRPTEFLASLGLRFLVLSARTASQRALRLALLVPASGPIRETLELAGMGNMVPLFEDEATALDALSD